MSFSLVTCTICKISLSNLVNLQFSPQYIFCQFHLIRLLEIEFELLNETQLQPDSSTPFTQPSTHLIWLNPPDLTRP